MDTSTGAFSQATNNSDAVAAAVPDTAAGVPGATAAGTRLVSAGPALLDGPRNPVHALRLPDKRDPAPHLGRMVVMSAWAAVLTLVGMVVAVRTFIAIMLNPGPDWLVPAVMSIGIAGTVCATIAFAAVHHKALPWQLLSLASLLLGTNLVLVVTQM